MIIIKFKILSEFIQGVYVLSIQKRVAAIHDISGFGKCSLTVALPILSALGIAVSAIPTAVLSTHTGEEFTGYTCRDLTDDLPAFAEHWAGLNIGFDAIYSGYLGSYEQIGIVSDIFDKLRNENTLIFVDPVMGDHGRLYALYSDEMAQGMKRLCEKADIIVPNMTEASYLTGIEYLEPPYTTEYIEKIMSGLAELGCKKIVLTGVSFDGDSVGAASMENGKEIHYKMGKNIPGIFHGSGDIFASALLGAVLCGKTLDESVSIAVDYIIACIERTRRDGLSPMYGVNFESILPLLIEKTIDKRGKTQ